MPWDLCIVCFISLTNTATGGDTDDNHNLFYTSDGYGIIPVKQRIIIFFSNLTSPQTKSHAYLA